MTDMQSPAPRHTPGPWKIEYDNDTGPRDESFIEWYDVGPARILIDRGESERAKADAALISAAPDLLAALKYARARLGTCARTHGSDDEAVDALMEPINAAIAKAEPS